MKHNVGKTDATFRTVAAAVLIVLALFVAEAAWLRILLAVLAAGSAATAFLKFCPIYHSLDRTTSDDGDDEAADQTMAATPDDSVHETSPTSAPAETGGAPAVRPTQTSEKPLE